MSSLGEVLSWGRIPHTLSERHVLSWIDNPLPVTSRRSLPYGLGRSYGDSCLNNAGAILETRRLNRLINFDPSNGLLRCEAGATLDDILKFAVPRGWFLPVTPGTKYVTVGGAIANDVHGKNHHKAGTWGCHTPQFELLRSDGRRLCCSATENTDFYRATIGGLGLTGLITWAEVQLRSIASSAIDTSSIKFNSLDEFYTLANEHDNKFEYTVAWLDCLSQGRGIFMGGNHAQGHNRNQLDVHHDPFLSAHCDAPNWLLSPLTVGAFNFTYYHRQLKKQKQDTIHYDSFFYPLDAVKNWNRIYGRRGFFQYQCLVPIAESSHAIQEIIRRVASSRQASFLSVLKKFGRISSPGLLSFPRPGITLALDLPNNGNATRRLFSDLDAIVNEAGGLLYPAKDACMSASSFQRYYPQWQEFAHFIDPKFSSSFWQRVSTPVTS